MSLIKWTPMWDPFEEFDRALDMPGRGVRGFVPAMDVYQDKDNVYVETALPGMDPEKVDVSIENDVLTIKGSTERTSEVEDKAYYRKEVQTGSFYRSVALPTHVVGDDAKAECTDGILKITVPKADEVKPKNIKVEVKKK
ncbi:Hsp20/alpha crystallin family protein [Candidatus Falkowbacteria bacterium]|nr:Hsp20/alpha crystallin family protein [Candidatus Falkowbacteria bacterium]